MVCIVFRLNDIFLCVYVAQRKLVRGKKNVFSAKPTLGPRFFVNPVENSPGEKFHMYLGVIFSILGLNSFSLVSHWDKICENVEKKY